MAGGRLIDTESHRVGRDAAQQHVVAKRGSVHVIGVDSMHRYRVETRTRGDRACLVLEQLLSGRVGER